MAWWQGRGVALALSAVAVCASVPWAFSYVLPQPGTVPLALAALAGFSPFPVALLLVAAALLRTWPAVAVAAALLAAQVVTLAPGYVGDGDRAGTRPVLTVMTANLRFGHADPTELVRAVRTHRVDVLAVEELTSSAVAGLSAAGLGAELPYVIDHDAYGTTGTGLWSRYPVREVPSRPLTFQACAGELQVAGQTVRVRAVHPSPPLGGPPGAWRHDYGVLRAQVADDRGVRTVLLGDFNASVHHHALRALMGRRWRDAAEVAGAGLVRTFAPRLGGPALLDPDHVLVDRGMGVTSWRTVMLAGSDHRAVIAVVRL
jgi:endonuclease/exonuclease/phosphatase (EEP) superfamily protein YafD